MNQSDLSNILDKAERKCAHSGSRLTEKRKRILSLLLQSHTPLSAYDIADQYSKHNDSSMPTMSVYRILDFLESESLVHKLSSENKYLACSHIACNHEHNVPQFLICGKCQQVKEIAISHKIIEQLDSQVLDAGYKLIDSQLELQCICEKCAAIN